MTVPTPTPIVLAGLPLPNADTDDWSLAYSTFYSGIPGKKAKDIKNNFGSDNMVIRGELVYPIYGILHPEELVDMITGKSMPPVNYYGAVLNNPDGTLCGEGNIDPVDGLHNMTETKSDCDFSADYSMSLNITPQLAARLKKGGLIPAKTKAYCLDGELGMCTYFDDGVTQLVHLRGSSNIAGNGQMEVGTIYDADIFAEKYAAGYALYEKENREHLQNACSWSPSDYTYHAIKIRDAQPVFGELLAYKPVKGAKQEENPIELLGFLFVMGDDSKHSFYLTETQLYSKEEGVLDATPAQCKVLHEFAKSCNADTHMLTFPQWLAYLTPARVTEFEFSGSLLDSSQKDISFS
ncbi:MAG: hypothetical protein RRY54_04225, partial [Angelakisella sp.]